MAANRLIVLLIIVMVMSTLAAALAPPPQRSSEDTSTSTTTSTTSPDSESGRGELIVRPLSAGDDSGKPVKIEASPGDQLKLTVTAAVPGYVSVPALGGFEFASPGDPAELNLVPRVPGRFPVLFGEGGRRIATIVVGGASAAE